MGAGLTLLLGGQEKLSELSSQNALFQTELELFLVIGLLSIYRTVFFFKTRKADPAEQVTIPKSIFRMIRLELILVFTNPLLAGLIWIGNFGS